MTREPQPNPPDPFRSAVQTSHPQIADEIEGAIKTLRKLKEIAKPEGRAASAPDAGDEAPATIAMTKALEPLPARSAALDTRAFAATLAGPCISDEIPLLQASTTFGRYQIVRMLGRGAMGAVYLAYDTELHRHVAIKTPFLGKSTQTIQRFYREARAAAQLRNAYLCPIYDVGKVGDVHYLSMAFIDGVPLTRVLAERRLKTIGEIVNIVSKIARGLQKAHEIGIVHRDLKPENIMVDADGEPIILDFGLARRVDDDLQVTLPGKIVGTPAFMSPEQVDGDQAKVGPSTDIYSLGIVLYTMLTGQLPFKGSLTSILSQIGTVVPAKPSAINPDLGEDSPVDRICMKLVAKSPADRFASMAEVAAALEALSGKETETPITRAPALGRLKSWSSGMLSSLIRAKTPRGLVENASSGSVADTDIPTIADSLQVALRRGRDIDLPRQLKAAERPSTFRARSAGGRASVPAPGS
jgi:serine/threonine protein kinase